MAMTPGIEAVTGSLGQGLSIGLGMALALRLDGRSSRVYVIMGDGELSEGQLWEAAMAAWRFKADNLVGISDRNRIQATGPTKGVFEIPDIERKWESFGWKVVTIDGHDPAAIVRALDAADERSGRPTSACANPIAGALSSMVNKQLELLFTQNRDLDEAFSDMARLRKEIIDQNK
jgi:transketolase